MKEIIGDYKAVLDLGEMKVDLVLHIEDIDKVTLDLPSQGAMGIEATNIAFKEANLSFSVAAMGMSFAGAYIENKIEGKMSQMEQELPVVFEKTVITLPGNPSLVSTEEELLALANKEQGEYKYKVEDYFQRPTSSGFQLSPNGKYLSYREKDEKNKRHVYVKEIETGNIIRVIEEGEELVRGYGWINDDRLAYVMDNGGDENYHIYAVNVDGTNNIDLTPFDKVQAGILNMLKEQKDYIIITMNLENAQIFEPYKININTGEYVKLFTNDDPSNLVSDYDFDKDGNLRGYSKVYNGIQTQYFYKAEGETTYQLFHTINWSDTFSLMAFNYASTDKDEAYVLTNLDSDKQRIVLYNFRTKSVVKEVYANAEYDASIIGLSRNRNWEIDYLGYEGEKVVIEPVSETFKKISADLDRHFGEYEYSIAAKTEKEDRYLIIVQSDKLYGKYYNYDKDTGDVTLLYDLMPQLKEEDMAEMLPISFMSRDGIKLHGYITLPKSAKEGNKVPLIVNPHGGPQGIRDSWGFNPETQLFASRGYATLQVNFRISGGYGKEFFTSGFKQIGRKVMDDVEDGVQYVIEQGWVDASKIAIYGASHGGYATLMGLVKTPELYTCGVDYVGVSSIFTFFESFPEYWKPYKDMVKEIWYDLDNEEEREIAREVSPVYQLHKINKPLFVVQGANDPRVKIAESDQIVEALRARGFEVPYMVKYDEGHGFAKEENSIAFYKCMMGFISEHLK
ncbi:S9 family peptidase [Myroides odoratimimus]|uniref:S9 family peptidase n=1 Tax=Myroides odoratimimus TaxID=76832 RepID=UPI00103A5959|nr:S9 family peptidase [Myroides odoratimimus]MCA4793039.1 S9 family peptidase [Myroides odoratimimus]MCA4806827.1 S9 family peptidase [Myroides odoratimimus]MCA4820300.1 S9 family peptidase [Myroides odoratimimus]MCS7474076.1 S9 family peptidase [Myroides odoratimimus]MDM1059557.1 S9 family peptidase [Myroides odoratimimus]